MQRKKPNRHKKLDGSEKSGLNSGQEKWSPLTGLEDEAGFGRITDPNRYWALLEIRPRIEAANHSKIDLC